MQWYGLIPSEFDKLTDYEIDIWMAAHNIEAEKAEFQEMQNKNKINR